jgi:1-acyl-sn-glycerol-3-phosphate acyltransferase
VTLSQHLLAGTLSVITSLICRIDALELEQAPRQGPLIFFTNHVNILEIPIFYTRTLPRPVHGMVLAERWNNPLLRWMLEVTESIPLHRGEADITAIRMGLAVLEKGEMLAIAPEGTRSHDGKLQSTHPGVVLLALHSKAPLIPVAFYGAENYKVNLRKLKRIDFHARVGKVFHLEAHGEPVTRQVRQKIMHELMVQPAVLLPPEYRGVYGASSDITPHYISFE